MLSNDDDDFNIRRLVRFVHPYMRNLLLLLLFSCFYFFSHIYFNNTNNIPKG